MHPQDVVARSAEIHDGRRRSTRYARGMRAHATLTALTALGAVAALAGGCPSDPCASEEPAYGGLGNDEVWLTLRERKADAAAGDDAPTIVAPAASAVLPAAEVPTFEWQSPLKIALAPHAPTPLFRRHAPSLLQRAVAGASHALIPVARAHLAPVSSDVYLVDLLVPGRACPVSIVTSELSHELDSGTWSLLREGGAGSEITMQLTSAYLSSGNITEGPYQAADVAFTIE